MVRRLDEEILEHVLSVVERVLTVVHKSLPVLVDRQVHGSHLEHSGKGDGMRKPRRDQRTLIIRVSSGSEIPIFPTLPCQIDLVELSEGFESSQHVVRAVFDQQLVILKNECLKFSQT